MSKKPPKKKPDKSLKTDQIRTLNKNTERHFKVDWLRNSRENAKHIKDMKSFHLEVLRWESKKKYYNIYKEKVCFICASGPSLTYMIPHIKEHREKLYLVCVDTAFSILCENDLSPDLVITLDCGQAVTRAFPEKWRDRTKDTTLLLSTIAPVELRDVWKGRMLWFNCINDEVETLVRCANRFPKIAGLLSRLNVADFSIFSLLRGFGFSNGEIAVSGMDLSFPNREQYYSKGTDHIHLFDEKNHQFIAQMDNVGRGCYSEYEFMSYRDSFTDGWRDGYNRFIIYWLSVGIIPLNFDYHAFLHRMNQGSFLPVGK